MYDFKKVSFSFTVESEPKVYGLVNRCGKVFYRKYGKELKNGKGKSSLDIFLEHCQEINDLAEKQAGSSVFNNLESDSNG